MSVHEKFKLRAALRPDTLATAVAFAMLAFPAQAVMDRKAVQEKAIQAVAAVRGTPELAGLQQGEALAIRSAMVNPQGRTVVHATQTTNGHRVWGSSVIVHAEAKGGARAASKTLLAGAVPKGSPVLSSDQAVAIAMKALALNRLLKYSPQKPTSVPPHSDF
jgi:Zn-dependent metalloprotease